MRSSTLVVLCAAAIVAVLAVANHNGGSQAGLIEPAAAATPVAPPSTFRTVTSATCSADGCPTACSSDEVLVSAICIGPTSAKFSDTLTMESGQITATCGPTSTNIVVSCIRK